LQAASKKTSQRSGFRVNALFSGKKKKSYYDESAKKVDPLQPAFTRRREVLVGRLAMVGFASALIGELTTGLGPLGQLQLELGVPPIGADIVIFGSIAYSLIGALNPASPTFSESNQRDVKKRGKGPTQDPKINAINNPKKFLGITRFGFSKQNEVFVGRTAQLGFLAAVIGEKVTGKGILSQVGIETGIPIGQQSIFLLLFISFFLFAALFEGNYGDPKDESTY
jgi:photosystem II protein